MHLLDCLLLQPAGDKVPNSVVYVYHQGRKVRPAAKPAGVKGARGGAQGGRGRGRAKKQPPEPGKANLKTLCLIVSLDNLCRAPARNMISATRKVANKPKIGFICCSL